MKKFFKVLTTFGLSLFVFTLLAQPSLAADVSSTITVTPASTELNTTTTYTITFTPATSIAPPATPTPPTPPQPGGFISLNIFSMSGPSSEGFAVNLASATLGTGTTVSGAINRTNMPESGSTGLQLTGGLTAGTSYTLVLNNVVNPSKAGVYKLMLMTNLMGTDLDSGQSGNIYLGMGSVTKTITGKVSYPDGSGVTTAQVNANQKGGQLFLNANTNAAGVYTLTVPGGEWEINLSPAWDQTTGQQLSVDWAYSPSGPPPKAGFTQDATVETKTINFSVVKATAKVKGKLVYPDGTAFTNGGVDIRSSDGKGVGGGTSQDGSFTINVPAGTYNIGVFSPDQNYAAPSLPPFNIADNETKDLGTIVLVKKNEFIKGTVKDKESGVGIGGVEVNAWSPTGVGFGMTSTASDGTYTLAVTPGNWEIMARPAPNSGYTLEQTGPPERISLSANQTVTGKDFFLTRADATIVGTVVDTNGNQITEIFGFAMAMKGTDPPMPGPGGEVSGGSFTIAVPVGTYIVNVHMGPDSDYSSTGGKSVTVAKGETKSVVITLKKNDATILGVVYDSVGNAVTGVEMEVGGHSPNGSFKGARVDTGSGRYQMGVVSGESWYLGVFVDPKSGYMMLPPDDNKVTPLAGQTVIKDFTLIKADATLKVNVKDPDGNALSNVFVFADSNLAKDATFGKGGLHTGDLVGASGTISLKVAAGKWGVGSGAPPSLGYINPEVQEVNIASGETKEITLQYKKSDAAIAGAITLDGAKTQAFVWAWSEKGAYSETMSFSGDYTLNVTKDDIWHVGADFETGGKFYRSTEQLVDLTGKTSATQDLVLTEAPWAIPTSLSQTISATQTVTLTLSNGMTILIPASSIATSGNITITVTPTGQLAKQKGKRPVGFGYEIKAYNSSGQEITSTFNSDVTITIPYTDAMLTDLGITEDQLAAAYFDATSSLWQGITSVLVDKDNNKVVITVNHFTAFSLVTGSSDTTPPANPTNFTATDAGGGVVNLSWSEPTDSDFAKVYVYRSTTTGVVGDKIAEVSKGTTTYQDSGLSAGVTYYYSLKSVDNTGNLSTGTAQVSVTSSGGAAATTTADATTTELPATGVGLVEALMFYLPGLMAVLGLVASRVVLLRRAYY